MVSENPAEIKLDEGRISVRNDDNVTEIPIEQTRHLYICSERSKITTALLVELAKNNVGITVCDDSHDPMCALVPIGEGAAGVSTERIIEQSKWTSDKKDEVWQGIVADKISAQRDFLKELNHPFADKLDEYSKSVLPGDVENREGIAAAGYFRALFGNGFRRHSGDDINNALNYGYTILLSTVTRTVISHGCNTALGIHHISVKNPYNLSCDIMEPFRPYVDRIVYDNKGRELDWEYKKEFIELPAGEIMYDGMIMSLNDAVEAYALKTLKELRLGIPEEKEIIWEEKC